MKPTVSLETAKQLAKAGFLPPEIKMGQFWYKTIFEGGTAEHNALCICLNFGGQIVMQAVEPRWDYPGNSGPDKKALFAPTALDILSQMPKGTRLVWHDEAWICAWELDFVGAMLDFRQDECPHECPHECAAKAFLAWKAGLA